MKRVVPYLVLSLLILLVYGNSWLNSFHFDDYTSILKKSWIRGFDKIPDFIFNFRVRPVVIITYNLNFAISELKVWSYHLFNIGFHLIATLLVYRLAVLAREYLIAGRDGFKAVSINGPLNNFPFIAGAVFALHPLNTQSVTYIASRSAILATILYLATLLFFFTGIRKQLQGHRRAMVYFLGAFLCLGVGGFTKEIIISVPAMLFFFHFYFVSQEDVGTWLKQQRKWLAIIFLPLVIAISYKATTPGGILPTSTADLSPATYLLTSTAVIPFEYFFKMLFPINLNVEIDFPLRSDWSNPANWSGIAVLGVFVFGVVALSLKKKIRTDGAMQCAALFGLVWAFVTILPASSFVPLLDVAVEHRTYLPMVGFAFFASAMICQSTKIKYKTAFALIVLLLFSALLIDRNRVWKNEITLWADAQKKSPRVIRTYNNLGQAYDEMKEYDHAIPQFEAALKLNPNYFHALSNLGNIYGKKRDLPKAIDYLKKALKVKPDYAPANYNLAKALHLTGNPQEAITYYRTAVRSNAEFEEALFNLANLSLELRQVEEAISHFQKFLRMQPNHPMAHFQLANAYAITGRFNKAISEYQTTAELKPDHIMAYVNIANILMQTGKIDNAIRIYETALTVKPVPGLHKNLGMIYQHQKHNANKAVEHYEAYLFLQPTAPDAATVRSVVKSLKNQ